ncbi:MAG: hypothetical protein AAGC55_26870, partial [Myxococcota bacterium]
MPHRHQDFRELCALCREFAVTQCRRCGRPLCADHKPKRRRRCELCEQQYTALVAPIAEAPAPRPSGKVDRLVKPMWITAASGLLGFLIAMPAGGGHRYQEPEQTARCG